MKKTKTICFVTAILVVFGLIFVLRNKIDVKTEDYFIFGDDEELNLFEYADFYVVIENGRNTNRINIDIEGNGTKYTGVVYLPGDINISDCNLFWESNNDIKVVKTLRSFANGKYALSHFASSDIFVLECNDNRYDFMLKIMKGSKNVDSLFINIDEEKGSIEDMNNDPIHETECYGKVNFGDAEEFISIKGRGNSTWTVLSKKPYNITFLEEAYFNKKKVSMIDGIKSKKWTLLANYADPTLMRNRIGYCLADDLGVGLATKYYDVWMNGNYLGNYLITPKNDYKGPDNGFILELDNKVENEDYQFNLENENGMIESLLFTIKDNSGEIDEGLIIDYMQKVWNSIEDFETEDYQNYIDVDSFAKVYLLNEIYKNCDIIGGNIYMHKDSMNNDDKLIAGPIWDLDNALGTTQWTEQNGIDISIELAPDFNYLDSINPDGNNYCFLKELGKHESFRVAVKEVYNYYRHTIQNYDSSIEENYNEIYDSLMMNTEKYDVNNLTYNNYILYEETPMLVCDYPVVYSKTNSLDDYINNFKLYLKNRLKFIDDNYSK